MITSSPRPEANLLLGLADLLCRVQRGAHQAKSSPLYSTSTGFEAGLHAHHAVDAGLAHHGLVPVLVRNRSLPHPQGLLGHSDARGRSAE